MEVSIHWIDMTMVGVYFVIAIGIGLYFAKRHESAEEYFLAGRSVTWPLIGLSLYASNMSSTTLVGLPGDAYDTGISVFNYEWMAAVILVVFAVFFLPFILRARVFTMPEFLERRFDRRSRMIFAGLTLLLNVLVDTAGGLYAGSLLIQIVYPQIPIWQTVTVLAIAAGIYTVAGGLAAVIITDAIQGVLLTIGAAVISWIAFQEVGGWSAVVDAVDPAKLSLIRPSGDPGVPWHGLLTGIPLIGFYFWCTNQFMVQRVLSAKSLNHGRWGSLFAGVLKLPPLFIMVLPGTFALVLYPNLDEPNLVFPTMMFDLLPVGLLGLVLAGFVAALMSQIDSTLNSASTLVTMDFVRPYKPDLTSEQLMWVGRAVTVGFMLLAVLWAPQIQQFPSLFKYLQSVLSYTVSPVVALFLVGMMWRRANALGAFLALATGIPIGLGFFVFNEIVGVTDVHFLTVSPILFAWATAIMVLVSLATPHLRDADSESYVWTPAYFREESRALAGTPLYANYRVQGLVLLAGAVALVTAFW